MRIRELVEQTTIGSTPLPAAGGSTVPSTAAPNLSGNVSAVTDPKFAAAQAVNAKRQKDKQRQQVQKQLADFQRQSQEQIKALQQQLADLNKP
jgi:small-conductance mechanosensitive channel